MGAAYTPLHPFLNSFLAERTLVVAARASGP